MGLWRVKLNKFDPDKISISEPDAEEVIAKIYSQ